LYEFKISLALANYPKTIRSITFQRTGGGSVTSVLNVMAVTVDHQTCLPVQNPLTISNITMAGATASWTAVPGATSYEWAVTTTTTAPTSGFTTVNTNSATISGLNNGTTYYFWVRNKCSATSWSIWNSVSFTTVTCPPVPASTISVSGITTVAANISWTALTGWNGYQVGVNTSSTTPPTTPTTQTTNTYSATGLVPGTTYYFWIRNMCPSPSNSVWVSKSFQTLACPVAGTPTIPAGGNIPFQVTFNWPGTTTPGVVDYQYQVNTSSTPNATLWTNTSATTATVTGLTPGITYYAIVRSNCSLTQSNTAFVQFINPYPPCDSPVSMSITNVNMHGANIKWRTAVRTTPMGYQYAITTSAVAPASGTSTTDTFTNATNLIGGQKYYVYVRTKCGSSTPVYSNFSNWIKDSFTTTATCIPINMPIVSNITAHTADVEWNDYPGIYGYEYRVDTSAASPTTSGVAINFNTISLASLLSGTNYYFHLRVRCDTFNFSPWVTKDFSTPPVCTATPVNPTLTSITPTTAKFNWSAVSGAQQYQYGVTTTPTPPVTTNTYTSTTSATVLSLSPSTPYYFHVRAYCSPNDLSGWVTLPFSTVSVGVGSIGGGKGYDVVIYPNPVKDVLNVEVSGKMHGKGMILLYDLSGKKLKEAEVKDARSEIDMHLLPQGVYILKYRDSESAGTLRVEKL